MEKDKLLDFSDYQSMYYGFNVEVGADAGDENSGQVAINDRPFLIQRITHRIIAAGVPFFLILQDNLYGIDWSLYEQKRFWKGAYPNAAGAFGNAMTGIFLDLSSPVAVIGNETIHAGVQNQVDRGAPITVQIQFHGIEQVRDAR